jgi:hypothetical protein
VRAVPRRRRLLAAAGGLLRVVWREHGSTVEVQGCEG